MEVYMNEFINAIQDSKNWRLTPFFWLFALLIVFKTIDYFHIKQKKKIKITRGKGSEIL
jgi:hypothetical protein